MLGLLNGKYAKKDVFSTENFPRFREKAATKKSENFKDYEN